MQQRLRLTRSLAVRAVVSGALVAPLLVTASSSSCVLADPPPALATVSPMPPRILQASVVPPANQIFTNWPAGGLQVIVYVQIFDPTLTYQFLVMEDYGTPNSVLLPMHDGYFSQADPDGGIERVPVPPIAAPDDPHCHTFTLFVSPTATSGSTIVPGLQPEDLSGNGVTVSTPLGSDDVTWTFDPSSTGTCEAYDAAGLTDAGSRDASSDAVVIVHVGDGGH